MTGGGEKAQVLTVQPSDQAPLQTLQLSSTEESCKKALPSVRPFHPVCGVFVPACAAGCSSCCMTVPIRKLGSHGEQVCLLLTLLHL